MACGVPIVGFDVGGVSDMVRDGITGLLASDGDLAELGNAILWLLEEPAARAEMAKNCRRIAVEEYSLEVQARRYVELYKAILAKN